MLLQTVGFYNWAFIQYYLIYQIILLFFIITSLILIQIMRRKLVTTSTSYSAHTSQGDERWWFSNDEDESKHLALIYSLVCALCIRISLIIYGLWQDYAMMVKYTDVDYYVFSDAASFVAQGETPYKRLTYRYTPLLAWLLVPNLYISNVWGKILFVSCDLVVGYLIFIIQDERYHNPKTALVCAQMWLFNPLSIAVSSRGNADSFMAVIVLSSIYCFVKRGKYSLILGFILHGLSIHVRIYSITYTLPIYLLLSGQYLGYTVPSCYWKRIAGIDVWPNRYRLLYLITCSSLVVVLTALFYWLYDFEFIQQTYLYHFTRTDTRHNFSVYFYALYLTFGEWYSPIISGFVFIPQIVLLVVVSVKYFTDLPFCCFLHTFIFVTFNKVYTSQYFLWYLCLLPIVVPGLRVTVREAVSLIVFWLIGQAVWLASAYFVEFQGHNSFLLIWLAGLLFFSVNIFVLLRFVRRYTTTAVYLGGKKVHVRSKLNLQTIDEIFLNTISKSKVA